MQATRRQFDSAIKIILINLIILLNPSETLSDLTKEKSDIFVTNIRSLTVPNAIDAQAHKCFVEMPTIFFQESQKDLIQGNGTNNYWTKFEVCCDGYKRYDHDPNICVPDCDKKCENGICVAPNECECFQGHVKNEDGECVTACPLGCLNGRCHFDGRCVCNHGYVLDSETQKFCRPICEPECSKNQNCTAPGVCECLPGYKVENGNCTYSCSPSCSGDCVGPNRCRCRPGLTFRDGGCQAKCYQRCENGKCIYQDYCQCDEGYEYDSHTTSCLPKCDDCFNGVCIAKNVCKCFKGYKEKYNTCQPYCSEGCINGYCYGPEQCLCRYGIPDKLGYCREHDERRCLTAIDKYCLAWSKPNSYSP